MRVYRFDTTRGMELKGLRFPFSLTWRAERGSHALMKRAGGRALSLNRPVHVGVEELFDVCAVPDETGAATGWLELEIEAGREARDPDWNELACALTRADKGFGLALAQSMFGLPAYAWKVEDVARELGVTQRSLQMTLFRESYSFDATLRRCRKLNALLRSNDPRYRVAALECSEGRIEGAASYPHGLAAKISGVPPTLIAREARKGSLWRCAEAVPPEPYKGEVDASSHH